MATKIGDKHGLLIVKRDAGTEKYGGRNARFWWCECEKCGREERMAETNFYRVDCCSICRRGPCVVCGGEIVRKTLANTCSDQCQKLKRQLIDNLSHAKRAAENPEFHRERYRIIVERMQIDPEYAEKIRNAWRASGKRSRANPKNKVREAEYQAARYAAKREEIQAQRKRFKNSLSIEEQARMRDRDRKYGREYRRRWRQWLRDNPEEHRAYIEWQRSYRKERQRQIELGKLRAAGAALKEKLNDE